MSNIYNKVSMGWNEIALDEKYDEAISVASSGSLEEHYAASLVFEELFVNIYQHAYKEKGGGPVMIHMEEKQEGMEIIMADYGIPFNPVERANWTASGSQLGGRGIDLIKSYSKCFEYQRVSGLNIVKVLV